MNNNHEIQENNNLNYHPYYKPTYNTIYNNLKNHKKFPSLDAARISLNLIEAVIWGDEIITIISDTLLIVSKEKNNNDLGEVLTKLTIYFSVVYKDKIKDSIYFINKFIRNSNHLFNSNDNKFELNLQYHLESLNNNNDKTSLMNNLQKNWFNNIAFTVLDSLRLSKTLVDIIQYCENIKQIIEIEIVNALLDKDDNQLLYNFIRFELMSMDMYEKMKLATRIIDKVCIKME